MQQTPPSAGSAGESSTSRAFWEQAHAPLAHISYDNGLHGSEFQLIRRWYSNWLGPWSRRVRLRGSRVGDYGIGAGLLGKVLCSRFHIGAYVGFDVANRSLTAAKALLNQSVVPLTCAKEFELVAGGIPEFSNWRLDVLISQQVIQHFPSRNYTLA